jgi:hypothetical protein
MKRIRANLLNPNYAISTEKILRDWVLVNGTIGAGLGVRPCQWVCRTPPRGARLTDGGSFSGENLANALDLSANPF